MPSARPDVLIVGAGPTGLVLALSLTRQGLPIRIVDAAAGPGTASRAMAVQARTLELYRQLDLADAAVAAGFRNPAFNLWQAGLAQDAADLIRPDTSVAVAEPDARVAILEACQAHHSLTLGQDAA